MERDYVLPEGLGIGNLNDKDVPKPTDSRPAEDKKELSPDERAPELPGPDEAPLHGHSRL